VKRNVPMKWLYPLAFLVIVNAIIIGLSLWPQRIWKNAIGLAYSSGILFLTVSFFVFTAGCHACDQGDPPLFVVLATATLAVLGNIFIRKVRWLLLVWICAVSTLGMVTTSRLANSYHRRDITGNAKYASGRFWHTPVTGQFPRKIEAVSPKHETSDLPTTNLSTTPITIPRGN